MPQSLDSIIYSKEKVEIPKDQVDALSVHEGVSEENAIRVIDLLGFDDALAYTKILSNSSSIDESLYLRNARLAAEVISKTGLSISSLNISPLEITAIDIIRKFNVRDRRLHR